jgi:preprotein translocase subunit SecB
MANLACSYIAFFISKRIIFPYQIRSCFISDVIQETASGLPVMVVVVDFGNLVIKTG